MGEMYKWILRVQPSIKPLIYFWRSAFRPSGIRRGCQKGHQRNMNDFRRRLSGLSIDHSQVLISKLIQHIDEMSKSWCELDVDCL